MSINEHTGLAESFKSAGFSAQETTAVLTEIAKMRAEEKSFAEKLEKDWSAAVLASECFYAILGQVNEVFTKYVKAMSDESFEPKRHTYTALSRLQRRAAQQYMEIITLVKNGFSDGAFARWRSMYELSVISSFILKYGEAVAEKFIEASESQDRYDWAMACGEFPETKRHVTFGDILKLCDMDTEVWRDNYTVANQTVHASPQGTFGRLGTPDGEKLNSGRSEYGIAAPAIQSANTLALVSSMLFSVFPEEDTMEKMSLAVKWLEQLIDIYSDTHDKLFPDDDN